MTSMQPQEISARKNFYSVGLYEFSFSVNSGP